MSEELAFKAPVRLATTAAITLSGEQTIDGATTSEDRVLVKNQDDTTQNGIYVSSSGPWERATDFDGPADFTTGTMLRVSDGAVNAGAVWACTVSAEPPDVGISTITWAAFNPAASVSGDLAALEALTGTGIARRIGADSWSVGTLVSNAELADMAQASIKGRATGAGTGDATDLTGTQATAILDAFTGDSGAGGVKGLVPAPSAGDAGKFLKGNGSWATGGGDLLAANNLSDIGSAATAFANIKQAATDTASGVVELATDAEAITGTDTTRAVTPANAKAAINARTESFVIAASDETTALTAGTSKVTFRMPYALTVTDVRASLSTAQTGNGAGGILTVDVNEGGNSILSTRLTIDNGEKTTTTAATARVISDTALADDAEITVDIDQVGDGTAKGLKVIIIGTRP
jgi:uncharacterized cupin superfamily protein